MIEQRFFRGLLRVPLAWKIAGANALLIVALALGFYFVPGAWTGPAVSSGLLIGVMVAAATVNVGLITLALRPIHDLQRAAEQLWSGEIDIRVRPSPLADRDVSRIANTINDLLEQLSADRSRLQKLTQKLLAARSSERAAFADELTESIAQSVAALSFELAAMKKGSNDSNSVQRLERLGSATTTLLEEIRRLARDLYPRHLDALGLESALRALVREAGAGESRAVTFEKRGESAGPGALSREVADTLYDVAREALRNACQHSGASRIEVSLGLDRHVARLRVTDDGCGFTFQALDANRGLGISLIRERMALVGGTLEVISRAGNGTRVEAMVPRANTAAHAVQTQANGANRW